MTRRAALGGALAIGAGAGASKLLFFSPPEAATHAAAGRPGWPSPLGSERARLAQLLRRATFGVTFQALEAAERDGLEATVDRLLGSAAVEPPDLVSPSDPTAGAQLGGDDLQTWWIQHILSTRAPFVERMTLFWHGHFTTEVDKAGNPFTYWQNLTWRRMALGKLGSMLREVTVDPAMLTYLDLASSSASDPSEPPNENYARELMELFTMGPGHYSEADVKAAARALAGWTTPPPDSQVEVVIDPATGQKYPYDVWYHQRPGIFSPDLAYDGEVTYLKRRGRLRLEQVIEQILAQPATATFLARKVATYFISAQPSDETVASIAARFRDSGYDVKALMRATLTSSELTAPAAYRSLVKSPVDFMVSAALAVGAAPQEAAQLITSSSEGAGQALFQPPNVAGWALNGRWISPDLMLARFNFVSQLLEAVPHLPPAEAAIGLHLDGVLGDATARRFRAARSERERWLVILTSPEFNLK